MSDQITSILTDGRVSITSTLTDGSVSIQNTYLGGCNISDADAVVSEVLTGKTFYAVSGTIKTGTMPNNGAESTDIELKAIEVTISEGYHNGLGKVKIATAEQDKIISNNIRSGINILGVDGNMSDGIDISDADATVDDVLAPRTFYAVSGGVKTGVMVDRGTVSTDIETVSQQVTIASGKHSGLGIVKIKDTEQAKIITGNIRSGVTILGVTGKSSVVDTDDANAIASEILENRTAYVNGAKLTGTIVDRGTVSTDITAKAQQVTIDAGRHSGSGIVQISSTEQAKIIASNIRSGVTVLGISGSVEALGTYLVRFIDIDGTILKQQYVNSGENATAPANPTQSKCTFYGWNRTYTNVTMDLDVGAIYDTTDGHTYLYVTITDITGTSPVIYLNLSGVQTLNIYNDSDNTLVGTTSGSGLKTITLTLSTAGSYVLRVESNGSYIIGQGASSTSIFSNGNYRYILTKCLIGSNVTLAISGLRASFSMSTVSFPSNWTGALSGSSLLDCRSLNCVNIPIGITDTGTNTFQNNYSLNYATLPDGLTTIGNSAFANNYSLEKITMPNDVTAIGSSCFIVCYSLMFNISTELTSIGNNAFDQCYNNLSSNLSAISCTIGTDAFADNRRMRTFVFPSNIVTVSANVLDTDYSLETITIPSTVTAINALAFNNCFAVVEYICNPTTPPTLANVNAFTGINSICKIKVPSGSVAAYQAATNWSTYANYIVSQ